MKNPQSIRALFALPGFVAASKLVGVFGDRYARVIRLKRRKKRPSAPAAATGAEAVTTRRFCGSAICRWPAGGSISSLNAGGSVASGVAACG